MRDVNENENSLPGVPFIESPFFDRIFGEGLCPPGMLTIAQDLRTKGYAILEFPDPGIGNRADRIISALHDSFDWNTWRLGRSPGMRIQDAWSSNEDVREIASNPEIITLLSALYGRRAFPFQTLNFPVGSQQHIHTDSVHFSSHPERFMCGVWVALEDVDLDNGPLIYCPGSHAWPIYTNEHIGKNPRFLNNTYGYYKTYEKLWDSLIEVHGACLEHFCPRRGQAIIWTANLLHGGDQVRALKRTRWSQVTHYYFEDCSYYTPLMSDPFCGQIFFRDLVDISSRKPVLNSVSGHPVDGQFIDMVMPTLKGAERPDGSELGWQYAAQERDAACAERDAACAERDAACAERDAACAERDAACAERDAACAERDAAFSAQDALLRSTSWRATAPLRALSSAVRPRR